MGCLKEDIEVLGPEKQIKMIWDFQIMGGRFSLQMRKRIIEYVGGLWVYEHAERAAVAEYICKCLKEMFWDMWGLYFEVDTSECTIYMRDHGGSTYALFVEGPGPNDIFAPLSFSLKRYEHS